MRNVFVLVALTFGLHSHADVSRYKYSELQIKDYDEMRDLVAKHTKKAEKILKASQDDDDEAPPDQAAVEEYRVAMHLILSRPNQDNMLAKLMPDLRKSIVKLNAFENSLMSLTTESMDALGNESLPVAIRSTYLFVLNNIINEFKPELKDRSELRPIFEKIRDGKVKVPKDVIKDLKTRSMFSTESPSDRAKRILDSLAPQKKK